MLQRTHLSQFDILSNMYCVRDRTNWWLATVTKRSG